MCSILSEPEEHVVALKPETYDSNSLYPRGTLLCF